MNFANLVLEIIAMLAGPAVKAAQGEADPDQIEAERQALILAQRRIQEEIARRELPP